MKKQPQKRVPAAAAKKQPQKRVPAAAVKKQPQKSVPAAAVKKQPQKSVPAAAVKKQPQKSVPAAAVKKQPQKKEITAADLGTRYKCYKCGTKFYDLGRPQPLCPSCGVNQNDDEAKGIHKRKKRRRLSTFVRTDHTITAPVESEDLHEVVNEVDAEYALDMDDIVLEEHADTDKE
jgi:hypothetical protein